MVSYLHSFGHLGILPGAVGTGLLNILVTFWLKVGDIHRWCGKVASLLLFAQLPDGLLDAGRAIFINNIVLDVMDQQGSIVDLVSLDDFDFLSWISFCLDRGMQALKAVRAVRAGE